jgi:hypothetical protein
VQDLKFPLSSTPGRLGGEGDGRLINAYAEKSGDQIYMRRSPGLAVSAVYGASTPRGMFRATDGVIYSAYSGAILKAGAVLGTLAGTDGVTWAQNNNLTIQMVACRESGGAVTVSTSAVAAYSATDADIPGDVNSVTFGNGYFFFSRPNGQIWASGLNVYDIDPLSFATAESRSDGLKRVLWHGGVLYAFGASTIEPWLDVGNQPFPLTRGTSVIPCGLLTTMAVAGNEEGWDRAVHFVAHDGTVRALTGYTTKVVSTPAVEYFIRVSTVSSLVAFVYTFRGHAMWVLTSDQGTWEFNATTGLWNERQSATGTGAGWRAKYSVKGTDNLWRLGDTLSTNLLYLSDTAYDEVGASLTFLVESSPFKGFPANTVIPAAFLDFTDAAATASISWSADGGATWTTPVTRSMANAEKWPVRVNALGRTSQHGFRLRVTVATAVDFSFMGASIAGPEARQAKPDEAKAA